MELNDEKLFRDYRKERAVRDRMKKNLMIIKLCGILQKLNLKWHKKGRNKWSGSKIFNGLLKD